MMMAIKCMYIMYFQLQLIYKGLPFHLHTTEIHKGIDEAEQGRGERGEVKHNSCQTIFCLSQVLLLKYNKCECLSLCQAR